MIATRTQPDHSYPREHAESELREHGVSIDGLTLDDLAERLSLLHDYPVTVREWQKRPVVYSQVFHMGFATGAKPWGT